MTTTIRRAFRLAVTWLAVGATVGLAPPVLASHVAVRTAFPAAATVGQNVRLAMDIHSPDGAPVPGTAVSFHLHMSFAGVEGEAEIGRAVTDEQGVATINYVPRAAGRHEVRMEYLAPGTSTVEEALGTFDVSGGEQLVRSAGGVDIPGMNSELLMAVLGTAWLILLSVAFRLVGIARAGGATDRPPGERRA